MNKIKISLEYGCNPIWDISNSKKPAVNISADSLPISKELASAVEEWNDQFQSLYINDGEEFSYKGFDTELEEKKFNELGTRIIERLEQELKNMWQIVK